MRAIALVAVLVGAACGHETAGTNDGTRVTDSAVTSTITIGETVVPTATNSIDYGNGNYLLAQQATLTQSATLQSLSFYVEKADGKLTLGVYGQNATGTGPGTLVAETASFTPAAGWNTQPVTSQVVLSPGTYWLAYLPSSVLLEFRVVSSGSATWGPFDYPTSGMMPSSFVTPSGGGSAHWSFYATLLPVSSSSSSSSSSATGSGMPQTPPTVATPAAASANPVSGTSVNLSVLGADQAGESSLTYTWATTGTPPAAVNFAVNGTNASKNATATFSTAGTYSFQVTIRDTNGLTATSSVNVTVQQTLTSIQVAPANASVAPGGTLQFSATAQDQFTKAMTAAITPSWNAGGSGTISPAGLLTAQSTAGGPFTVTATSGSISGTAQVTVASVASTITIGETMQLGTPDSGNGGFLLAQQATLSQAANIQSLSFYVTTAAGTLVLGIYDATGANNGPGTRLAQTASFTPVKQSWNTQPVTTSVNLPPGNYWLAYLPSDVGLAFLSTNTGSSVWHAATPGSMPSAFGTSTGGATGHWSFYATLVPTAPPPPPPPPPNPSNVHFVGRVDYSNAAGPRFAWPGSGLVTRVQGTRVDVQLGDAPAQFFVDPPEGQDQIAAFVDGNGPTILTLDQTANKTYTLAQNLASGPHDVAIYKRTETEVGTIQFIGFTQPIVSSPSPFVHKIEFVGDSITCGFGIDIATDPLCFFAASENAYLSYGAVTARNLNAAYSLISWSGQGMYQNSDGTLTNTVPLLYGRTLGDDSSSHWDFTSWTADVVVINLGTNDASGGTPGNNFVSTYETFLQTVHAHYPNAIIIAAIGPMLSDPTLTNMRNLIQEAIVGSGVANVQYLEFPPQLTSNGVGCDTHPSAITHGLMATQLTQFIKGLTGW
jgi:hypothetical protein